MPLAADSIAARRRGQAWTGTRPHSSIQSAGFWKDPQARPALEKGCRQCARRVLCYRNFARHHYTDRDLHTRTPHTPCYNQQSYVHALCFRVICHKLRNFSSPMLPSTANSFWASPSSIKARSAPCGPQPPALSSFTLIGHTQVDSILHVWHPRSPPLTAL
jgi:hypothetical protein